MSIRTYNLLVVYIDQRSLLYSSLVLSRFITPTIKKFLSIPKYRLVRSFVRPIVRLYRQTQKQSLLLVKDADLLQTRRHVQVICDFEHVYACVQGSSCHSRQRRFGFFSIFISCRLHLDQTASGRSIVCEFDAASTK